MKHLPDIYPKLLERIKTAIQAERSRAIQQLTRSLIIVYWDIGKLIVQSLENSEWGKGVVEQLSKDLQKEFPGKTGFSARNLRSMRQFYETYKDYSNMKQLVSQIPWGHHILIMQRTESMAEKEYYLRASADMRWSRNVLLNQMKAMFAYLPIFH